MRAFGEVRRSLAKFGEPNATTFTRATLAFTRVPEKGLAFTRVPVKVPQVCGWPVECAQKGGYVEVGR